MLNWTRGLGISAISGAVAMSVSASAQTADPPLFTFFKTFVPTLEAVKRRFISPEGGAKDVFVHATAVEAAGMRSLTEGQRVSFDIQPDARGAKAVNLKLA
jgi:CspA family cold shock protein